MYSHMHVHRRGLRGAARAERSDAPRHQLASVHYNYTMHYNYLYHAPLLRLPIGGAVRLGTRHIAYYGK